MAVSTCRGCGQRVRADLGSVFAKQRGLCADCRASQSHGELVATTKEGGAGVVKLVVAGTPLLLIVLAFTGAVAWWWGVLALVGIMMWAKSKK